MKRIPYLAPLTLLMVVLAGLSGIVPESAPLPRIGATVQAAGEQVITYDVACDCRTGSPGFFTGVRGDAWIVSGKIFPAGTLPSGTATNDPTLPVRGVAPIGDWTCRGQASTPYPPSVGSAYDATPFAFNTQYFMLKDGRGLTVEGFAIPTGERLSITGGIGAFSGIAGQVEEGPFGTNITGCPNFRAKFAVQPGSLRGASTN